MKRACFYQKLEKNIIKTGNRKIYYFKYKNQNKKPILYQKPTKKASWSKQKDFLPYKKSR